MAREFGGLSYANISPQYVGQDVEGIRAVSKQASEEYDINLGKADAMELAINDLYSKVRTNNSPYIKEAYNKAQADLKDIKDSGRWEDAQYKVQKAAKDFAMNNNVKGALIDKQSYDSWLANLEKRVGMKPEEGGITTEQRDNAVKKSMNNPNNLKPTVFNEEKLSFDNVFKGYSPVKYRDIGARMFEIAKGWKADETPFLVERDIDKKGNPIQVQVKYNRDLGGYYTTYSVESVSEDEVNKALRTAIESNPEDMAYIQEQEMFHKENNFKVQNPDGSVSYRTPDESDINKLGFTKEFVNTMGKQFSNNPNFDFDTLNVRQKEELYNQIARKKTLDSYIEPAASKEGYNKIKASYIKDFVNEIYLTDNLKRKAEKELKDLNVESWETTFSKQGEQSIKNLTEITKAEPTNTVISKIANFVSPYNQAKGLLNILKIFGGNTGIQYNPYINKIENELKNKTNLSEDELSKNIEKLGYEVKQKIGEHQKAFKNTFGFNNFALNQSYDIVDFFTKEKEIKSNPDYNRIKDVVRTYDKNFNNLSEQEQFNKVKEEMTKFAESSKTNIILVPETDKELKFKNEQISQFTGNVNSTEKQLTNLGLTANGKFLDFYTQKEVELSEIMESGTIKYMGQLDNDNQSFPAANYFQGTDGKFYVSPGSLNDQKDNYINWNLKQFNNKFSKEYEFPLQFKEYRTGFKENGKVIEDISKIKISKDLNTGKLEATSNLFTTKVIGNNEDEIKIGIAKELFDKLEVPKNIKDKNSIDNYKVNYLKQLGF